MNIVLVKGMAPGERDRMWVTRADGSTEQVPINVAHDLPHLVVESAFGLEFGFWGLIDAGAFTREIRASHARDARRAKDGRAGVLVARPDQSPVGRREGSDELLAEHSVELRAAKALTNAFHAWGARPRSPAGIRAHLVLSAESNPVVRNVLDRISDADIELVLAVLPEFTRRWAAVPPGETMRLRWPLPLDEPRRGGRDPRRLI